MNFMHADTYHQPVTLDGTFPESHIHMEQSP